MYRIYQKAFFWIQWYLKLWFWPINHTFKIVPETPLEGPKMASMPHCAPGGFGIDSRLGAAAIRAPAASKEDSRPHAILKLQLRNSFDYRVCYEPQLKTLLYQKALFSRKCVKRVGRAETQVPLHFLLYLYIVEWATQKWCLKNTRKFANIFKAADNFF